MKTTWQCSNEFWGQVAKHVNHALVYLDCACAEMLHWHGGIPRLLQAGAADVREFSAFEMADRSAKKAVFVVGSLLSEETSTTLEDIISNSSFQYVVVVTAVSPQVHRFARGQSMEGDFTHFFSTFEEEKLLVWMRNPNYTAEVLHIPLFSVDICPGFFVTPAYTSLFPLLSSDLKQVELQLHARLAETKAERKSLQSLSQLEAHHLPPVLQNTIKMFISGMEGMLEALGMREDLYSLGHLSRIVATELENYPPARARRKKAGGRLSLLFVDRALDLASPLSQQFGCLLDKLQAALPRLPDHNADLQIDMTPLCHVHSSAGTGVILPGCLASSHSNCPGQHLDVLVHKKVKEGIMEANRQLVEAASQEKFPLKLTGKRTTSQQLDAVLTSFKGQYAALARHLDVVQTGAAVKQAVEREGKGRTESRALLEKSLVQALDAEEGGTGAFGHLLSLLSADVARPRDDRQYTLDDVLWALTFLYSMTGEEAEEEEEAVAQLQCVLAGMVEEARVLSPLWERLCGAVAGLERKGQLAVEQVWSRLEALGAARSDLSKFSSVTEAGSVLSPPCLNPLLKQLTKEIFSPEKPDLVDVACRSSGLKDLLGMFLSVSKPRPGDQQTLIIFVLGGVTATEVKQIHDTVEKSRPSCQVIVGSTRFARAEDILHAVFAANNVNLSSD